MVLEELPRAGASLGRVIRQSCLKRSKRMTSGAEAIFNAALALPTENRAALAEKLLESLAETDRAQIDEAWAKEAERRIQAYVQGRLKALPGDEVIRSLRSGTKP